MCNQFHLPTLQEISHYLKSDLYLPLASPTFQMPHQADIFPKMPAPILLYQKQKLQLVLKKWGYPSPVDQHKPLFNARIERFYEQRPSMWDHSFARQRCIILSKYFFESGRYIYRAANGHAYHERFCFQMAGQPLTMIAGIYDQDHFAMVTTTPNKVMAPIHRRMPLVLQPTELRRWLFQNFTPLRDRSNCRLNVQALPHKK